MRSRRSRANLWIVGALCASALLGGAPPVRADASARRWSFDMELSQEPMSRICELFDFAAMQEAVREVELYGLSPRELQSKLYGLAPARTLFREFRGRELTDDYLQNNPAALDRLPTELREKLTRGLDLGARVLTETTKLVAPDGSAPVKKPVILGPDGGALAARPRLVTPNASAGGLILPGSLVASPRPVTATEAGPIDAALLRKTESGVSVTRKGDWEELRRRWLAVDIAERARVIEWQLLGPQEKAALARVYVDHLEPRKDLPIELRRFLHKFVWDHDRGMVEIKYRDDVVVRDKEELYRDVSELARRAGVEREILDPEAARMSKAAIQSQVAGRTEALPWGSFHVHASEKGKALEDVVRFLNVDLALRRISLGIASDWSEASNYGFFPGTSARGLVRIYKSGDHFETRTHHEPLRDELARLDRLLAHADPKAAVAELAASIGANFTPEAISVLANAPDQMTIHLARLLDTVEEARPGTRELWVRKARDVLVGSVDVGERARALETLHAFGSRVDELIEEAARKILADPKAFRDTARTSPVPLAKAIEVMQLRHPERVAEYLARVVEALDPKQDPAVRAGTARMILLSESADIYRSESVRESLRGMLKTKPWLLEPAKMLALAQKSRLIQRSWAYGAVADAATANLITTMIENGRGTGIEGALVKLLSDTPLPEGWQAPPWLVPRLLELGARPDNPDEVRYPAHALLYRLAPELTEPQLRLANSYYPTNSSEADAYAEAPDRARIGDWLTNSVLGEPSDRDRELIVRLAPLFPEAREKIAAALRSAPDDAKASARAGVLYRMSAPGSPDRKLAVETLARPLREYNRILAELGPLAERLERERFRPQWSNAISSVLTIREIGANDIALVRPLARFRALSAGNGAHDAAAVAAETALAHLPASRARAASGRSEGCGARFAGLIRTIQLGPRP